MNELIKITENNGRQAVSARELHQFLDINTRFDMWAKRMIEYGFTEGIDFCTILSESTGGRPSVDYALTIIPIIFRSGHIRCGKGKAFWTWLSVSAAWIRSM